MRGGLGFTEILKERNNAQSMLIRRGKIRRESCKIFGKWCLRIKRLLSELRKNDTFMFWPYNFIGDSLHSS